MNSAKQEFIEKLDRLCDKVDKDYQELKKRSLSLSLENILKQSNDYDLEYKKEWNKLEDFYLQHKLSGKLNFVECQKLFNSHTHKLVNLRCYLRKIIQNNSCYQC